MAPLRLLPRFESLNIAVPRRLILEFRSITICWNSFWVCSERFFSFCAISACSFRKSEKAVTFLVSAYTP